MHVALRSLAVATVLSTSGCLGLAHRVVEMPPLLVQGVLLDSKGQPTSAQSIVIALSNFYGNERTFEALRSGALDRSALSYKHETVRTGPQGEFAARLPGESRYIGFMPPLMYPSEDTLRSFVLGVRTPEGTVLAIVVEGSKAKVRVPVGTEPEFAAPPTDFPFSVSATATRSAAIDVLQLTVRARNEGA